MGRPADSRLPRLGLFTAFLVVAVVLGNATAHSHALTAGLFALLSLILFGGITARVGLYRTPGGTILGAIPLTGAGIVLDWGLLAGVLHWWSIYFPVLILIGLAVCGVIAALCSGTRARRRVRWTTSPVAANALLLAGALLAGLACGGSRAVPPRFWTVAQAESIKVVRGTPLKTTKCTGLGERRASAYERFKCVGVHWPKGLAYPLPVRVRYVLNPRGTYRGKQSPYLMTSVFFDSFGVP